MCGLVFAYLCVDCKQQWYWKTILWENTIMMTLMHVETTIKLIQNPIVVEKSCRKTIKYPSRKRVHPPQTHVPSHLNAKK